MNGLAIDTSTYVMGVAVIKNNIIVTRPKYGRNS